MTESAPLQPFLLSAMISLLTFSVACGGTINYPPGISTASVTPTQNPLVAQYTVASNLGCSGQVMVEFGPDTSYGRSTAWYPASATSQTITILVAGMKANTTYHMRAQGQAQCAGTTNTFATGDTTFTTGPLPSLPFPTMTVTRPSPSATSPENPGIEIIDIPGAGTPAFFTDRDANPIWYYDVGKENYAFPFKLLPNGHVLLGITRASMDALLIEVDLAGNTIRAMDAAALGVKMQAAGFDFIPAYFHHDFLPLPNGHVILLTNFTKDFTDLPGYPGTIAVLGDGIVDLDENWNPVWAWNSFDYLDVNRHLKGLPDWTHSNAIIYSTADGNLLLSIRHQSWVLKIDYDNGTGAGDILWKLGYQGDFAMTQGDVPTADPSLWFSFQHFPSLINQTGSQTTLAVWDNGNFRVLDSKGATCGTGPSYVPCYSRATIFQVEESTMVANLAWDTLPGYYSDWGGSINQLANTNVEFDINDPVGPPKPTFAAEVQEVTQTSTPQIVWKLDITPLTEYAYRAYRVPSLYPGVSWPY